MAIRSEEAPREKTRVGIERFFSLKAPRGEKSSEALMSATLFDRFVLGADLIESMKTHASSSPLVLLFPFCSFHIPI